MAARYDRTGLVIRGSASGHRATEIGHDLRALNDSTHDLLCREPYTIAAIHDQLVRNDSTAELISALWRARFAVDGITVRRLRMEFPAWIARTRTPASHAAAIRSLQDRSPAIVREHSVIGPDGSVDLESVTLVARAS